MSTGVSNTPVKLKLTGVYIRDTSTQVTTAYFAELPQVVAEGSTEEEAEENLLAALGFILDIEREEALQQRAIKGETKSYDFELAH